ASADENGTISSSGNVEYWEGESVKYTFTPAPNYEVEEVFVDGEPMGLAQATSYTFPAVDKDYTIHVTFRLIQGSEFTITASAGENGAISPSGETSFSPGASAEFIFTPDPNYEVEEVFIDAKPMGLAQATSYTFPAVDKDYTIHVTFKKLFGIKDANGVTIAVAPNPVNDQLFVTGRYDKLEIISLTGQILTTAHNQPVVDVNHLAKGIYFVKIQANEQTCTFKVIK
ncbi:MAG: T9SS type A sorting domain-containing protein, partial [Lentimicrobiaceae bacterium]|nr:T9SS type A sorting domain-containing protein [Lentimicrobiaceae bacterium]